MAEVIADAALEIARAVKARRVELDLSQEALASRMKALGVGWHQTTVAKVESTTRPRSLSLQESIALAFVLGVPSLDQLVGNPKLFHALRANYAERSQREYRDDIKKLRDSMARALSAKGVGSAELDDALAAFDERISAGIGDIEQQYSSYVDASARVAKAAGSWKDVAREELAGLLSTEQPQSGLTDE